MLCTLMCLFSIAKFAFCQMSFSFYNHVGVTEQSGSLAYPILAGLREFAEKSSGSIGLVSLLPTVTTPCFVGVPVKREQPNQHHYRDATLTLIYLI